MNLCMKCSLYSFSSSLLTLLIFMIRHTGAMQTKRKDENQSTLVSEITGVHKKYIFLRNIVIASFFQSRCNSTNSFQTRVDCFPLPFTNKPDSVQQLTDFLEWERKKKNIIIFVVDNVVVKKMGWWYLYLSTTKPIHLFILASNRHTTK